MTPQQKEQWNSYACGPRCLIQLATLQGNPISPDDFLSQFLPQYPKWNTNCGLTCTSDIIDIAREMKLCTSVSALRNKNKIRDIHDKKQSRGILVISDVIIQNGVTVELNHFRLLLTVNHNKWVLWHPNPDGRDMTLNEDESTLEDQLFHFLVLN